MKYRIFHWFNPTGQPVPEAYATEKGWFVDVDDFQAFCEKNGPSILCPPNSHPYCFKEWGIIVTDKTGRFNCK